MSARSTLRIASFAVASLAVVLASRTANAKVTRHAASFDGAQVVPSVATRANGSAVLLFDDSQRTLTGTVDVSGLSDDDVAVDLKTGGCGETGELVALLGRPINGKLEVDFDLEPAEQKALLEGRLYINVRTGNFKKGELRGQVTLRGTSSECSSPSSQNQPGQPGPIREPGTAPTETTQPQAFEGGEFNDCGFGACATAPGRATESAGLGALALATVLLARLRRSKRR